MLVSVIMSVRNAHKTLEKSINSILDQTYSNYELLILDDYSTDDTLQILNKFKNRENIKIVQNEKNLGLTKSLNILIKKSNGTLIARQDADDYSIKKELKNKLRN